MRARLIAALVGLGSGAGCALPHAGAAIAAEAPAAAAPPPMVIGVQTHFAFDREMPEARVVAWLREARVDSTRDEMFWSEVEGPARDYAIRGGAEFTRRLWWTELPRVQPLLILGYGHPAYDGGGQPATRTAVAGYAAYAGWLVANTRPRVRLVELWNEWNLQAGARPAAGARGGPAEYVHLAAAASAAVKAADASVRVLVGGLAEDLPDWRWLRAALPLGLLDAADGVSVHLYNHCDRAQVGADEMVRRLDGLQALLTAHARREVPVYVTEVGWPTHRGACEVSEPDAAAFVLRLLLEGSIRRWLGGIWIYEAIDGGNDESNREQRFGLLRRDGSERPAGCMVREFGALIGSRPAQLARLGDARVALYREAHRTVLFAWGPERAAGLALRLKFAGAPPAGGRAACGLPAAAPIRADAGEWRAALRGAVPVAMVLPPDASLEGLRLD